MGYDVSKRQFLTGAGMSTGAAFMMGNRWIAPEAKAAPIRPVLAIYDSRWIESADFAAQARAEGLRLFDIAGEDKVLWATARAGFGLSPGEAVAGMTRWTDWLIVRDILIGSGRRVRHEMRLDCCAGGAAASFARLIRAQDKRSRMALHATRKATLFAWTMA